jgi:WD40 repeat protein
MLASERHLFVAEDRIIHMYEWRRRNGANSGADGGDEDDDENDEGEADLAYSDLVRVGQQSSADTRYVGAFGGAAGALSSMQNVDDRLLLAGSNDGKVHVWTVESGRSRAALIHPRRVSCVSVLRAPSSAAMPTAVVTGCADQLVRAFDLETGTELAKFSGHSDTPIAVCAIDSNVFVSAGERCLVQMWDMRKRTKPATVLREARTARSKAALAYCERLQSVLATSANALDMIDVRAPQQLSTTICRHGRDITGVHLSAGGRLATLSASEVTLKLWQLNANDGRFVLRDTVPCSPYAFSMAMNDEHVFVGGRSKIRVLDFSTRANEELFDYNSTRKTLLKRTLLQSDASQRTVAFLTEKKKF